MHESSTVAPKPGVKKSSLGTSHNDDQSKDSLMQHQVFQHY